MSKNNLTYSLAGELLCSLRVDPYFKTIAELEHSLKIDGRGLRGAINGITDMGINLVAANRGGLPALAIARESRNDADFTAECYWADVHGSRRHGTAIDEKKPARFV